MAMICALCGSADTQAGLDAVQCLTCGALTNYNGEAAPHVEYASNPEPLTVIIPPGVVVEIPAGLEGYVEGAASVEYATTLPSDEPDLESMTKAQLADLAEERGVDIPSSATKADMVEALSG